MAFTEFYVQTTGSNLNSGSTTADAATYTATNGNWNSGTGVFTPTSGDPSASVAVGDFASVYLDAATVAVFVGRVTAVDSTTITVSLTAVSGTPPSTGATGRSIKVGGAWKGPNAAEAFPFGFATGPMVNAAGDTLRVNIKGGTTYNITATMVHNVVGGTVFQGYTTSAGDGGRATIDGGTSGASYILLNPGTAADNVEYSDLIFQNNGATGNANAITNSGTGVIFHRVVVSNIRGTGLSAGSDSVCVECEAYSCGAANGSQSGFVGGTGTIFLRCIAHDNTGSTINGFNASGGSSGRPTCMFIDCIADSNGDAGITVTGNTTSFYAQGCDFYNNGGDGLEFTIANGNVYVENCNFVKNTGDGIDFAASTGRLGYIKNCGFGAGTQANASEIDTANMGGVIVSGSITYSTDAVPWNDPATGDFTVTLDSAQAAGRGTFTQTASSYTGTVAYPCIGAGQPAGGGGDCPTAAEIADAVWDEARSGHTTSGTFGEAYSGYSATRGLTGTALPAVAAGSNGGVPLVGTQVPNATAGASGGLFIAGTNAATTVTTSFTTTFTGNLTGSVGSVAAGGIVANSFGAGAIDAAALAADAGTEIGTAVWASGTRTLTALDEDSTTLDLDATIRAAVGMAAANLDTQIGTLATAANLATAITYIDTEVAAILADTNELQVDWTNGGRLDLLIDAIKAKTDSLTFTTANKVDAKLTSDGLDNIATTAPSGVATTFREMMVQVWRRFFKKITKSSTEIKTFADNGTDVLTTQAITDSGTDEVGAAS